MPQRVGIIVYGDKAYVPVNARFPSGIYAAIDPVYEADLTAADLGQAVGAAMRHGHPPLPEPTREEWRQRKDPILTATKARSWKELARNGAAYSIDWSTSQVRLDMTRRDDKGRWQNDPQKVRLLPAGTPLEEILELILADAAQQLEVLRC
jgi:hypothetical protein